MVLNDYSDIHRSTLQTLMNHGMIEEEGFKKVFKIIWQKYNPDQANYKDEDMTKIIDMINEKINQFDQKIIKYQYGKNSKDYMIFCSTAKTSISTLQNTFNEYELDYFKLIYTQITENEDLCISPRESLNQQSNVAAGKLSKVRAEKLIDLWIDGGYFFRDENMIYLGPKSLVEFKENLQSMETDYLKKCSLCEELVITSWGVTCNLCKKATFHKNCIQKFIARSEKCPSCKKKWSTPIEQQ